MPGAKCMLAEEDHETRPVLIHRAPLTFNERCAFYDVGKLYLFVAGELRNANLGQLFIDGRCRLFREGAVLLLLIKVAVEV